MTQKEIDKALVLLCKMADDDTAIQFLGVLEETDDTDVTDEAALFKFAFGSDGEEPSEESSAVYYPSSEVLFTTTDWQSGAYPSTLREVADYDWTSLEGPGYILNGLPRTFAAAQGLYDDDFAAQMTEARIEAGLTLKQLDELSGVNFSSIAKIEAGKMSPTIATVNKLLLPLGKVLEIVDIQK